MKKLALFAMLCVSVVGFSIGCSDAGTDTTTTPAENGAAAPAETAPADAPADPAAPAE